MPRRYLNIKTIINKYPWLCNVFQVFGEKAPFPLFIMAHLTLACQCSCRFCYQNDEASYDRNQPPMTPELFRQILTQAGTSMLAQANQVPQNVIQLLQR